jgi:TolA-binding protein
MFAPITMIKTLKAGPMRKTFANFGVTALLLVSAPAAMAQSYNADGTVAGTNQGALLLSPDAGSGVDQGLFARQQQRMDLFDTDLKALRGSLEQGLRTLQMQIAQLSNSASSDESDISASIRNLQDKIERLTDTIAMTDRRMERTLEITSDVEFRLLRLEKRMQTLMTLGGDDLANAAVAQDTLPVGQGEQITMQRNDDDGSTSWTVDETKLNEQLANDAATTLAGEAEQGEQSVQSADAVDMASNDAGSTNSGAEIAAALSEESADTAPKKPQVLPETSPDEQYRFALGKALQNDLEMAEKAFAEFRVFNAGHTREADAAFWLGRVQFMRGSYEKAAMTFSEFNSDYPGDARLVDTTMWIAESVSHFAPKDQACEIYASLPSLLDSPPDSFTERLAKLSSASNCDG